MNYLKWTDFNTKNYKEVNNRFGLVFIELLPNNSKASLKYHYKKYIYLMINAFELKLTFEEELDRFKSYLIETYELKAYY